MNAQRISGYAPMENDKFITPAWVTEALLTSEQFPLPIWEPACATGIMIDVLNKHYKDDYPIDACTGTDIAGEWAIAHSFLSIEDIGSDRSIITNPPYSNGMAEKFLRHAVNLTKDVNGKVAMLLPINFDAAKTRRDLFAEHPAFIAKYILTDRIRWENLDQVSSPSTNHAWFVFDWDEATGHPPILGYLP